MSKPISYFKIHLLSGISGGQLTRQPHIYQDWCASNTGGCRAGSQMCAGYCGCNGNLLSCCCSYGAAF
ncbi:hypothetical protein F1748_08020 [Escherichia coli]|nr:hypothetical protein F1748_08020 [Escherichia coli]